MSKTNADAERMGGRAVQQWCVVVKLSSRGHGGVAYAIARCSHVPNTLRCHYATTLASERSLCLCTRAVRAW